MTIGNSVKSIDDGAFYFCWKLTSVTIPNSVILNVRKAMVFVLSTLQIIVPLQYWMKTAILKNYSYLTVFAGDNATDKDYIVVAGNNKFKIFETIPESSGVRQISYSGAEPSYFGINGQKYNEPQQGLNIVVDGETTNKIVVK